MTWQMFFESTWKSDVCVLCCRLFFNLHLEADAAKIRSTLSFPLASLVVIIKRAPVLWTRCGGKKITAQAYRLAYIDRGLLQSPFPAMEIRTETMLGLSIRTGPIESGSTRNTPVTRSCASLTARETLLHIFRNLHQKDLYLQLVLFTDRPPANDMRCKEKRFTGNHDEVGNGVRCESDYCVPVLPLLRGSATCHGQNESE